MAIIRLVSDGGTDYEDSLILRKFTNLLLLQAINFKIDKVEMILDPGNERIEPSIEKVSEIEKGYLPGMVARLREMAEMRGEDLSGKVELSVAGRPFSLLLTQYSGDVQSGMTIVIKPDVETQVVDSRSQ